MISLLTGLEAWWTLEETSGTRVDSHGSNDLTDNNTVLSGTGIKGTCADIEASTSEYLSITDNASLSVGDIDFTWAAWINLESKNTYRIAIHKGSGTSSYEYVLIYHQGFNRFWFSVTASGGVPSGSVTANNLGIPSTGTWYFIVAWHDASANQLGIQINDGTADTASYTFGSHDSANSFSIGRDGAGSYYDGLIDEVAFWKKVLSTEEKTWLYNSGAGRTYSDIGAGGGVPALYYHHNRKRK